jgi:hypothetical protein
MLGRLSSMTISCPTGTFLLTSSCSFFITCGFRMSSIMANSNVMYEVSVLASNMSCIAMPPMCICQDLGCIWPYEVYVYKICDHTRSSGGLYIYVKYASVQRVCDCTYNGIITIY